MTLVEGNIENKASVSRFLIFKSEEQTLDCSEHFTSNEMMRNLPHVKDFSNGVM